MIVYDVMDTRLYTADELLEMGGDFELDCGVLVPMSPGTPHHGRVCAAIGAELYNFVKGHRLGAVYGGDTGFHLESDPDTVKGPDVAFVRTGRLAGEPSRGFWKISPDLAVEVRSPGDTLADVRRKISRYVAAGCLLGWLVDYENRRVEVSAPDVPVRVLLDGDVIDGGDVLPASRCP